MKSIPAMSICLLAGFFPLATEAQITGPTMVLKESLNTTVLPNRISGTAQGGNFAVTGNGLATTNLFKLDTNGLFTGTQAAPAFTTNLNETFSYSSTARSSDSLSTVSLRGTINSGNYSIQSGRMSGEENGIAVARDTFAIQNGSPSSMNVGKFMGKTNSVTRTGSLSTSFSSTDNSRTVQSTNDQVDFSSEGHSSKFQVAGSGMSAVTAGGFQGGQTAANNDVDISALIGGTCEGLSNCATGGAFDLMHEIRVGDDSKSLTASPDSVSHPGYGTRGFTVGGTTAGAISIPNTSRELKVVGGGAGTSSSLRQTNILTVFR